MTIRVDPLILDTVFLADVSAKLGVAAIDAATVPMLEQALQLSGMPEFFQAGTSADQIREHRERILEDLLAAFLAETYGAEYLSDRVVLLNLADVDRLTILKGVGNVLANAIVAERRENGYFSDATELQQRIDGIGPSIEENGAYLQFDTNPVKNRIALAPDLISKFQAHITSTYEGVSDSEQTLGVVYSLQDFARRHPSPLHRFNLMRSQPGGIAAVNSASSTSSIHALTPHNVEPILDSQYFYKLQNRIDAATNSIFVKMFYAAMRGPSHPTRQILNRLVTKSSSGLDVRVILDRDDVSDPYGSTLINEGARDFLTAEGVSVKYDLPHALMHSKVVILDRAVTILGSHNWTAGSYFNYHDASVVIESPEFSTNLAADFESYWVSL